MIRILFFLIPVFLIGLGFAWLADRPGEVMLTFGGVEYQVSLLVAAAGATAIVVAAMLAWWLIKNIWNSPHNVSRYFRRRRRDRGYDALSSGMIAAGAGDGALARRKNKEAMKLLGSRREPLVHLLEAQALLLEGDHDKARSKFEAMLDDPDMKLLGLRGLYLEAERMGDRTAARHYAEKAVDSAPQLGWASGAALEERTDNGDWDQALRLVETQKGTGQIDRDMASRRKAVLLTAKAMAMLDAEPVLAKNASLEATRLAPELVPASIVAARALFRLDDLRKGAKVLEAMWKRDPHPQVADAYVHARLGDSTQDRLTRAKKLQSLRQNHPEAAIAVARAALATGEYKLARENVEAAIRQSPREGAYLLLADIEEAETGDQGRVRQWLGKAVRAPQDPVWVADGYVSEEWSPVSPLTGRLDAFEWRQPVERLGQVIEAGDQALAITPTLPAPATSVVATDDDQDVTVEDVKSATESDAPPLAVRAAAVDTKSDQPLPQDARDQARSARSTEPSAANDAGVPAGDRILDESAESVPVKPARHPDQHAASQVSDQPTNTNDAPQRPRALIPDDPGVEEGETEPQKARFKLF